MDRSPVQAVGSPPLSATGTTPLQAAERCTKAFGGLRRSVAVLDLERPALTESLLVGEVRVAVDLRLLRR